jgi:hypothetical protein
MYTGRFAASDFLSARCAGESLVLQSREKNCRAVLRLGLLQPEFIDESYFTNAVKPRECAGVNYHAIQGFLLLKAAARWNQLGSEVRAL